MISAKGCASQNDMNILEESHLPGGTVSSISWSPINTNLFAVADGDAKIRFYECDFEKKGLVQKSYLETEENCLSVNWLADGSQLFAGCNDKTVKAFDIETKKSSLVGKHDDFVTDVHWESESKRLISLSLDKTMKLWDLRQKDYVANCNLRRTVYCSDLVGSTLAAGLSDQKILVVRLRDIGSSFSNSEFNFVDSPLGSKEQLTSIALLSDDAVAVGSADGRANISKFQEANIQHYNSNYSGKGKFVQDGKVVPKEITVEGSKIKLANLITFKCHQIQTANPNKPILHPVTGIGFHPQSPSFIYTAGGDGKTHFWDYKVKDRIIEFNYLGAPVTKTKMSPNGNLFAYSLKESGEKSQKTTVCCHIMSACELEKPKLESSLLSVLQSLRS